MNLETWEGMTIKRGELSPPPLLLVALQSVPTYAYIIEEAKAVDRRISRIGNERNPLITFLNLNH